MASRVPLVLLACGSFNPITHQHMRLFELARDHMHQTGLFQVVGGILSPVSDVYGKQGLAPARHRVTMARLALSSSEWVRVDDWESKQADWTETVVTMRYHYSQILKQHQNATAAPHLKLLCGADFLDTFKVPGLWRADHIAELVGRFGLVCVNRGSLQPDQAVHECDTLSQHKNNIFLVRDWIKDEISATEVRRSLRRGLSVKYLLPDAVIDYIRQHDLYTSESEQKNKDGVLRPLSQQGPPPETLAD